MFEQPQVEQRREEERGRSEKTKRLFVELERALGEDEPRAIELLHEIDEAIEKYGGMHEEDFDAYIHHIAGEYPSTTTIGKTILLRREDPERLFQALENQESLKVDFRPEAHGGDSYPNAGILGWDGSGLRIPYQRGFGKIGEGKIIVVVGFTPNFEHLSAHPIPEGTYGHYTDIKERSQIRMVEGEIAPEEIKFIIARFPKKYFPQSELTEEESEKEKVMHVSRVYSFGEKEKDHRQ